MHFGRGIFHNLVLVSIDKRYPRPPRKIMSAFWGLRAAHVLEDDRRSSTRKSTSHDLQPGSRWNARPRYITACGHPDDEGRWTDDWRCADLRGTAARWASMRRRRASEGYARNWRPGCDTERAGARAQRVSPGCVDAARGSDRSRARFRMCGGMAGPSGLSGLNTDT